MDAGEPPLQRFPTELGSASSDRAADVRGRSQALMLRMRYWLWDSGGCLGQRRFDRWQCFFLVPICAVVIILSTLILHRSIISTLIVALFGGSGVRRSGSIPVLAGVLRSFLAFPAFHFGLLQEASLLGKPPAFLPVLDFIFPNQGLRRRAEDHLILAEFANPCVFRGWWVMVVVVFLPHTPLPGRESQLLGKGTMRLLRLLLCFQTTGRCFGRGAVIGTIRYIRAGLGALGRKVLVLRNRLSLRQIWG